VEEEKEEISCENSKGYNQKQRKRKEIKKARKLIE